MKIPGPGKAELVYTAPDGTETRELIHNFDGAGIIQGMHNINASIESFARSCFSYALDTKQDLWFATKDTISKKYDHTFKDIFQEIFDAEYKNLFDEAGIEYFYTLIDDAVARVMKSEGGYIWACKNYDGDVMSDMVSSAFGSLAMMTSVPVSYTHLDVYKRQKESFRLTSKKEGYEEALEKQINYMWEEYELTYNHALEIRDESLTDPAEMRRRIQELKTEIRKLGSVNVNAIEDFKNLSERYEFMKTQHDDLVEAEATLKKIIEELDEAMRKQFTRCV